jgi:hypothetical protein
MSKVATLSLLAAAIVDSCFDEYVVDVSSWRGRVGV